LNDEAIQALFPVMNNDDEEDESLLLPVVPTQSSVKQSKLQILSLRLNQIRLQGIQALVPYLQHPEFQIHSLCLDYNPIGDAGAMALADALCDDKYPASIVELSLMGCDIGTVGLTSIFEALQHAPTLEKLSLEYICGVSWKEELQIGVVIHSHDMLFFLAEILPQCQLQKLAISGSIFVVQKSKKQSCQDAILQGLANNWSLMEVKFSEVIVDKQHQGHISYYTLRNKFQDFIRAQDQHVGNEGGEENGNDESCWSRNTIPKGLWSYIFASVANKECSSKVSVLYHLLCSRPDVIAARYDSNDINPTAVIQSRTLGRHGTSSAKRDQSHVSKSTTEADSLSRKKR
jgi:hypothetical protein